MSQQPFSTAALRGAVDLGALAANNQRKAAAASGPRATSGFVVDVTEADFQSAVIERSMTVPVVVDLFTARAEPSVRTSAMLDALAVEFAGRFLLARVDIDTSPALAQAFQVQTLPFVVAVLRGQPVPLLADLVPLEQVRQVLDKLLEVAAQNGVTGTVAGVAADGEATAEAGAGAPDALPEEPLPPLHQEAYDAIERDDLAAAVAAYEKAIAQNPTDDLAAVGLANVLLMQRTEGVDPATAVAAADAAPDDAAAQLLAADCELVQGEVDAAFDRLVETVRTQVGDEREQARQRLVELFAIVGSDDPSVRRARVALTRALY